MIAIQRCLGSYSLNQIRFRVDNLQEIEDNLEDDVAEVFGSFPTDFDMRKYFAVFIEGTRKFILGESVGDIPKAKHQLQTLKIIDIVLKAAILLVPILAFLAWMMKMGE